MKSETRGLRAMIQNRLHAATIYTQPQYWDAKAQEFGPDGASGWTNQNLNAIYHQKEIALLEKTFPNVQNLKILDAGCGTGRISRHFAKRGAQVTGIDFSARAIEFAKTKTTNPQPTYRVQSVLDLTDDQQYDIAVTFGVLSVACASASSLAQAATNLHRALRPGGKLLLAEPFHRGPLALSLKMTAQKVAATFRATGLKIESISPLHFWPLSRPLAYFPFPKKITAPLESLGDAILRKTNLTFLGDYKIILASRPATI